MQYGLTVEFCFSNVVDVLGTLFFIQPLRDFAKYSF